MRGHKISTHIKIFESSNKIFRYTYIHFKLINGIHNVDTL